MECNKYIAYTDGSCDNTGSKSGGAAYIILQNDKIIYEASKRFKNTSNNRMEMLAIISAVNYVPNGSEILVITDSQYAMNIFIGLWKPTKNKDLIELYHQCAKGKKVRFRWIHGHNGNPYNERVDKLASYNNNK